MAIISFFGIKMVQNIAVEKNNEYSEMANLTNKISTNEKYILEFITGHVIYNPAYTYKFQLKTTKV